MTMRALFGNAVQRLLGNHWGTKVNGTDTGVHPAMEELAAIFASQRPIELSEPLQLNWNGDDQTPPIQIHMTGDAPSAIGIYGPNGERTLLGFGLGNEGLWANAYVPLLQMEVPYETIDARYRDGRYQGSGIATTRKASRITGIPLVVELSTLVAALVPCTQRIMSTTRRTSTSGFFSFSITSQCLAVVTELS